MVTKIHLLLIIELIEGDFSISIKVIFNHKLVSNTTYLKPTGRNIYGNGKWNNGMVDAVINVEERRGEDYFIP